MKLCAASSGPKSNDSAHCASSCRSHLASGAWNPAFGRSIRPSGTYLRSRCRRIRFADSLLVHQELRRQGHGVLIQPMVEKRCSRFQAVIHGCPVDFDEDVVGQIGVDVRQHHLAILVAPLDTGHVFAECVAGKRGGLRHAAGVVPIADEVRVGVGEIFARIDEVALEPVLDDPLRQAIARAQRLRQGASRVSEGIAAIRGMQQGFREKPHPLRGVASRDVPVSRVAGKQLIARIAG